MTGDKSSNPYIINITAQNRTLKPLSASKGTYYSVFSIYVIHNVQIPITWLAISNSVIQKDGVNCVNFGTAFSGLLSWYAIANASNHIGSCIGISFSGRPVGYFWGEVGFQSSPEKLDNPLYYVSYNATIAVVKYTIYYVNSTGYSKPIDNVSIFQVLATNPERFTEAVENSTGITSIYVNGKLNNTLTIGNGTLNFFIGYLQMKHEFSVDPYEYINDTRYICIVPFNPYRLINNNLSVKTIVSPALSTTVALLLSLSHSKTPLWLGLLLNVKTSTIFTEAQQYPFASIILLMGLRSNVTEHVYVSYFSYPTKITLGPAMTINYTLPTTLSLGFILNYSSYYHGLN